ncbi:MAG: heavy metal translocating P-type ATPase [Eubacterium sp.]|nr:heavy metal translocating P-type ATPase [Eubacterium sp.]
MSKKLKNRLIRIIIALVMFAILMVLEHTECFFGDIFHKLDWYILLPIWLVPYITVGFDVLFKAFRNISHGKVFDENFLMMIATFGAFAVQEFSEAVAVMLFYQVGELFQSYAVGKSRESITAMMEIVPEFANVEEDGVLTQVDPDDVEIGTVITILPGEKVPLDGIVVEGTSMLDTAALTGESVPRSIAEGDEIISGCVNGSGTLKVKTTKEFDDSTVSKILELVENASSKKAKTENFITRFAKYYTPVVTVGAVLLAVIPPIFMGGWLIWMERACIFLVISCPCALVISVPLGFFGGIGAGSKIGVLVKGSNYLEACAEIETVVFDKTGTITKGEFNVSGIYPTNNEYKSEEAENSLLRLAALAEGYSTHPIALSIKDAYIKNNPSDENSLDLSEVTDYEEIAGLGIHAFIYGQEVIAGNDKIMKKYDVDYVKNNDIGTIVYLAAMEDDEFSFVGSTTISDSIKSGVSDAISDMKKSGIKKTVMLTGDHASVANEVAKEVHIDDVYSELLPADKVEKVESLLEGKTGNLAFVGDGINDAPVLTRADVGIAMGSMGSDAAIEAADVVIMDDDISKIGKIIRIARKTIRIVKENIVFALFVKFAVLILGALGFANMWEAVFADVGVAVIAILNSMRMLRGKIPQV